MSTNGYPADFDCIVIGSGFGGSVMTYRLAAANRRVLLLERGKPYPPGSFARTPLENSTNVWDPSERLYGLFDIWSFKKFEAVVSSGLGGGSLIYANVMFRKPEDSFDKTWPLSPAELRGPYEEVEKMLGVREYPLADVTAKTKQFGLAAKSMNLTWHPAPIAVSFGDSDSPSGSPIKEPNLHHAHRTTCVRCGQCDVGCNFGSKNSLDLTYLSRAAEHGASIETLHEVRQIKPLPDGRYEVDAVRHVPPNPPSKRNGSRPAPEHRRFRAKCVVLAAGSLGSTYLLLRNRINLPSLSDQLGQRFCGNADYLGFIRTGKDEDILDASRGPTITSYVEKRRNGPSANGGASSVLLVEDGGYPVLGDWLGETLRVQAARRILEVAVTTLAARLTNKSRTRISAKLSQIVGDSYPSRSLLPMLGMGQDLPRGVMGLRDGDLEISWQQSYSQLAFDGIRKTMNEVASGLRGRFQPGPSNLLSRMITVHPLGGVPMGRSAEQGAVDSYGEVFGYPGLFVADGSIMPGPVGVNPALTIAAVAERASSRVIEKVEAAR
jgi:cholesterol oxidase